jgi:hypothetical protein
LMYWSHALQFKEPSLAHTKPILSKHAPKPDREHPINFCVPVFPHFYRVGNKSHRSPQPPHVTLDPLILVTYKYKQDERSCNKHCSLCHFSSAVRYFFPRSM